MPLRLAWAMRSQTMRKYAEKPIEAIVSSSKLTRSTMSPLSSAPQRWRAPSQVRWARYSSAEVKPSGNGKSGSSTLPKTMSTSARSAIHSVLSHASGWSRNR